MGGGSGAGGTGSFGIGFLHFTTTFVALSSYVVGLLHVILLYCGSAGDRIVLKLLHWHYTHGDLVS